MQNLTGKTVAIMISLLMIISIGAMITQLPKAAGAINIQTFAYINVAPNPCGVGQTVTVDFWLGVPLEDSEVAVNMTLVITNPNGATTVQGPYISDITGGTTIEYVPTMLGNYTFQFVYGGQILSVAGAFLGDYEEPSNSSVATLDVTSTPAVSVPFTPLPTEYWQTPVNSENVQNWYAISGPWLGLGVDNFGATGEYNLTSNLNPYTTGPTTAHILWTKPWCVGGVAGDGYSSEESGSYWTTSQYAPKWQPVVIDGIEYATWYTTSTGSGSDNGIVAVNLYNGQTMWVLNTTNPLRFGMVVNWETINQYGCVGPWIWTTGTLPASQTGGVIVANSGTQYNMYDGLTGQYIGSVVNGTTCQWWVDANGNLIGNFINSTAGTEIVHPIEGPAAAVTFVAGENARMCAVNLTEALGFGSQFSLTIDTVVRFELGIIFANPSIPNNMTSAAYPAGGAISPALAGGGYLSSTGATWTTGDGVLVLTSGMATTAAPATGETSGWMIDAGFDQYTGNLLWIDNRTYVPYTRNAGYDSAGGFYANVNFNTLTLYGYNIRTGDVAWTTPLVTSSGGPPDTYDEYSFNCLADPTTGITYWYGLGGDIWAINMATGNIIWWTDTTILTGSSGTETPYGIWPIWTQFGNIGAGQNNLLYLSEGHEYSPPLFHGAQQLCINMTNGQLVWKNLAFDDTSGEVSYGIATFFNSYDGQIYAYGQGPSATTVTAPNPVGTVGQPMIISGTVMDVSAGASQEAVAGLFPHGLPCVSDASQEGLMDYAYEQQPLPTNIVGVPVTITAVDPNGNYVTLGTTTTIGSSGVYGVTWTPPDVPGNYTVTATFAGSGAYYPSSAVTTLYVGPAPATPAPTAPPVTGLASQSSLTLGIAAAVIAIIIAIAIVGILLLRKKP